MKTLLTLAVIALIILIYGIVIIILGHYRKPYKK